MQVVRRAGGDAAEEVLLRCPPAQGHGDLVVEELAAIEGAVFGQRHDVAAGPAAGHNGDLLYRVGVGQEKADDGVTGLVIGDGHLVILTHHPRLPLRPHDHAVEGVLEL